MTLKSQQMGFSLIEVLITLIVVSLATIGAAVLQLKAVQAGHSAYLHTQATLLAHDMSERMRANPAGLASKSYHLPTAKNVGGCFTISGCDQDEMAQSDMYEWAGNHSGSRIKQLLPEGAAVVCIDSTPDDGSSAAAACDGVGDVYAIKIWWRENSEKMAQNIITAKFN